MLELFRNYEIDRIGAPADRYYHNDLDRPDMPDYKLYVFVNTMYLDDGEREVVRQKLKKNHAAALFLYGSGVINPDRDAIFAPENITDLTGIKTKMNSDVVSGKFKFYSTDRLISERLDRGDIYGDFKRKMWANASHYMNMIKTSKVNLYPELYAADEEGTDVAYLLENKHAALTIKNVDGFTSIYCASKYLGSDVVREIARYAGCHIYMDNDDVLYANQNYITIHAQASGQKVIKLPKKASAYELYEKRYYSELSDEIVFDMVKGETKMFEIR